MTQRLFDVCLSALTAYGTSGHKAWDLAALTDIPSRVQGAALGAKCDPGAERLPLAGPQVKGTRVNMSVTTIVLTGKPVASGVPPRGRPV